jgi:hypothetical protein
MSNAGGIAARITHTYLNLIESNYLEIAFSTIGVIAPD